MTTSPHTTSTTANEQRPTTLAELRASGWRSRPVKQELKENLIKALENGDDLFPGIVGYEHTVIPEIINALLAGHDVLFLGEKGQAKSRLMRLLARFLDDAIPYLDIPSSYRGGCPVHEDPYQPITTVGKAFVAEHDESDVPIAWWSRDERYVERLAPGTKFADIIGELDPAKLAAGESMSAEGALHFGLIPRMHRGLFAMNELPDLDDMVQTGLFNILEERDVQIRGHPIQFDLDIAVFFSANPQTYHRSGKVIAQLKDRIGATIRTHYPHERDQGIEIMEHEAGIELDGDYPVKVPRFMSEICEQMGRVARRSKYVDQASGVSARFSIANYRTMIANARQRGVRLGEKPAVPRISDLSHFHASAIGKLELDMMASHQMSEHQVLESLCAQAIREIFEEYVDQHGLEEIGEIFGEGVKIEVGDMLPSKHYADRLKRVPPAWEKAFEVNPAEDDAVRAACVEFVLAGLYASDQISRTERHGRIEYEL